MDNNFATAFRLMTSAEARDAFDLTKEPRKVRERYGMTRFGQSCLLARRLIEAGVRFVTVNTFITVFDEITWDIHGSKPFTSIAGMRDNRRAHVRSGLQRADRGPPRARDAGQHARLQPRRVRPALRRSTRPEVAITGLNAGPCTSRAAGCRAERVVGRSDEIGGYPAERPVTPAEVVATIYHSLGLDLETELPGPQSRPFPLVDFGTHEIRELF